MKKGERRKKGKEDGIVGKWRGERRKGKGKGGRECGEKEVNTNTSNTFCWRQKKKGSEASLQPS